MVDFIPGKEVMRGEIFSGPIRTYRVVEHHREPEILGLIIHAAGSAFPRRGASLMQTQQYLKELLRGVDGITLHPEPFIMSAQKPLVIGSPEDKKGDGSFLVTGEISAAAHRIEAHAKPKGVLMLSRFLSKLG